MCYNFKRFGNLLLKKDGSVWITPEIRFPEFFKFDRNGESNGYLYARCNERDIAVHRLMGRTWVKNPLPHHFDRIDHRNRIKTDNSADNLLFVNAHLNAINRENTRCTQFCHKKKLWKTAIMNKGQIIEVGYYKLFCEGHLASMKRKDELYRQIYCSLLNGKTFL
jgi:hypothetical protein